MYLNGSFIITTFFCTESSISDSAGQIIKKSDVLERYSHTSQRFPVMSGGGMSCEVLISNVRHHLEVFSLDNGLRFSV